MVYPALAAGYTLLCARKHFLRTLPLFVPSLLFTWVHMLAAPMAKEGVYVMHWDLSIFQTLFTYWTWTVGPTWLLTPWNTPFPVIAGVRRRHQRRPAGLHVAQAFACAFARKWTGCGVRTACRSSSWPGS